MAQAQPAPESLPEDQSNDGRRERSTIGFPYQDLDSAIEVARAVHELTGSSGEMDQIAGHLGVSPKSSGFTIQVASAKVFGLVTGNQGTVTLTTLGQQICDQHQEKPARVEAFLAVPLYRAIYERFRGVSLPPDTGLEAAMVSLGVAQKQKERARQIFRRSAQSAGFFQFGADRLVQPAIKASATAPALTTETEDSGKADSSEKQNRSKSSGGGGEEYHPFIQGLLRKLPAPDSDWPMDGRIKWLQTAANIFDLMYTNSDEDNKRAINISFQKDSAR